MPFNLADLNTQIVEFSKWENNSQQLVTSSLNRYLSVLADWSEMVEELARKVDRVSEQIPNTRLAYPRHEKINATFPPLAVTDSLCLIAVDGSGFAPDRHFGLVCGAVNCSTFSYFYGTDQVPEIQTRSRLIYHNAQWDNRDLYVSEELIERVRDSEERNLLYQECLRQLHQESRSVTALTDGPLELWGSKGSQGGSAYRRRLTEHLLALEHLHMLDVTIGGYIDAPIASPVLWMLDAAQLPEGRSMQQNADSFHGVTDMRLFAKILPPGHRSAVFKLRSRAVEMYTGDIALYFFYINVGVGGNPVIARIEVPAWVAMERSKLDTLHTTVVDQCRLVDGYDYPYALARAHEEAVIGLREKSLLSTLLSEQLEQNGIYVAQPTQKQAFKNIL